MKKSIATLLCVFSVSFLAKGQSLMTAKSIEYVLPAEDCQNGQFYLGKFLVGSYQISCNVSGVHANNRGWSINIGKNWGSTAGMYFTEFINNIGGSFYIQREGNEYFHLWWDGGFSSSGQSWIPALKVEYSFGNLDINASEPARAQLELLKNSILTQNNVAQLDAGQLKINFPNTTVDWNAEWQNGFFDAFDAPSSPESGWFWGINIGHRSNNPHYRYGGQLVIKNASDNPSLFFRSRNEQGAGVWAKVLHNMGDQQIKGSLVVDGTIRTEEIKVEFINASLMNIDGDVYANKIKVAANGQTADFVFDDNYELKPLQEVELFIKENKHLPDIPSAAQMEANGVDLAEMNKLLLHKVEELTLYVIELEDARSRDTETRIELMKKLAQQQNSLESLTNAIVEIKACLESR